MLEVAAARPDLLGGAGLAADEVAGHLGRLADAAGDHEAQHLAKQHRVVIGQQLGTLRHDHRLTVGVDVAGWAERGAARV